MLQQRRLLLPAIGPVTRLLHWITTVLLAAAFGLAWSSNALEPGPTAGLLIAIHLNFGLSILGLTVLRLVWRSFYPLPPLPYGPAWESWLAHGVQAVLYTALVMQPLLGWASSNSEGDPVTLFGTVTLPDVVEFDPQTAEQIFGLHRLVGFVVLMLLVLHIGGALHHALIKRDGVLRRMLTGHSTDAF